MILKKLFFLILFLKQLNTKAQDFNVTLDTLHINLKEFVKPATIVEFERVVKYKGNYYCFIEENSLYSFKKENKYFVILSNEGQILKNLSVPEEINSSVYFDFFVKNDSLIAKVYGSHKSFNFDIKNFKWKSIPEVDDSVYEDENFDVTYLDFGEWGETTWFIDKKTKKEYSIKANGRNVTRFEGNYYLTGIAEILEIENPLKLRECTADKKYNVIKKRKIDTEFYESTGTKTIYSDSLYSEYNFKYDKAVHTTFIADNQLYHLNSDSIGTYISKISDEKLIAIQNVGRGYYLFNYSNSYRGNSRDGNKKFLKFANVENQTGYLEIENKAINMHYFKHNLDTLKHLGNDHFDDLLKLISSEHELTLQEIEIFEESFGGINMKTDKIGTSHNGYYPEKYKSQDVKTKEFVKAINQDITQIAEYLYDTKDKSVKSIFISWNITKVMNKKNFKDFSQFHNDKSTIKNAFREKLDELVRDIIRHFGNPIKKDDKTNERVDFSWTTKNNLVFNLSSHYGAANPEIRLIIQ